MGISSDGQLCLGIDLGSDESPLENELHTRAPWYDEDDDDWDFDRWWLRECGWTREWTEGDESYFDDEKAFRKKNPCPAELVWYCSYEYPIYALAVAGTFARCARGHCEDVGPLLEKNPTDEFFAFCEKYLRLKREEVQPKWLLTSMYG